MSISVENQYVFVFSIGKKKDFIFESELLQFTLIEEAGNILPTFQLGFYSLDDTIMDLFHEGNDLVVQFGKDRNSLIDCPLQIMHINSGRSSANKRLINCTGLLSANSYRSNTNLLLSALKSAVEVITDVAKTNKFKVESNITASDDSQVWIQPNTSDKKFINELWMHSYLANSFIAIGITSDKKFVIKDIIKDLKSKPKYNFTKNIKNLSTDIAYDEDYNIETNTGFINSIAGFGKEILTYNLEDGTDETISETPSPVISLTNKLAKRADIEAKFISSGITNDNIHTNYHRAALKNFTKLVSFGTIKVTLSFHNNFIPIQVLDRVTFKDDDISTNRLESAESQSGEYYVSKVSRTVSNKSFNTVVVLCRESNNQIKFTS